MVLFIVFVQRCMSIDAVKSKIGLSKFNKASNVASVRIIPLLRVSLKELIIPVDLILGRVADTFCVCCVWQLLSFWCLRWISEYDLELADVVHGQRLESQVFPKDVMYA